MTTRHDPRLINLVAGFLAREFGEDGFLPLSKRDGAAVRLLDLVERESPPTLSTPEPDLDAALANVLARSAALPPIDTDGMTLKEKTAATIRQVVARSPLRLNFPDGFDPDAYPEDRITGYPDHVIVNGDHIPGLFDLGKLIGQPIAIRVDDLPPQWTGLAQYLRLDGECATSLTLTEPIAAPWPTSAQQARLAPPTQFRLLADVLLARRLDEPHIDDDTAVVW